MVTGRQPGNVHVQHAGDPELFVADANGDHPKRLTFTVGVNTSPAWNPKTGQQVVFVSDRGGTPQLYMMNSDGTNVEKIALPDMGYVIDPGMVAKRRNPRV